MKNIEVNNNFMVYNGFRGLQFLFVVHQIKCLMILKMQ